MKNFNTLPLTPQGDLFTTLTAKSGEIHNGDCIELMNRMTEKSVDLIVTDPPYLVNYTSRDGRTIANDCKSDWVKDAYKAMYRVLKNNSWTVTFFGTTKVDIFAEAWKEAGFRIMGNLVFPKSYASNRSSLQWKHETAYILAKGKPSMTKSLSTVLPWAYTGNKHHPTQKPLEAIIPIIESLSNPGDMVCDPFAGSGTTLISAIKTGRKYLGFELDETYYQAAKRRLAWSHKQELLST